MARNNTQNAGEKRVGARGEPAFTKGETKFCSRILGVRFGQASRFCSRCAHIYCRNDSTLRFYLVGVRNSVIALTKVKKARLFIGYVLFAGIATVVDVGLLYVLTSLAGVHYLTSAALSYCAGMVTNYSLNKLYNFKDTNKKIAQQFGVFVGVALVGLVLNQLILWLLVEHTGVWYILAKLFSVGVVMFWSFIGHYAFTFKSVE